ncbi:Hypothetical predicted protein [Paramuricea clavata]|uniref:Uncharacterized protein n=1 Tax=Paramuricea clavata TaxID=317549 RepID=A0A6S7GYC3_PARCT|nr:Hypothetical predicted protein [Paramuricea clavata]
MASALTGQQDYKCIAEKYSKNNAIQIKLGQQFVSLLELGYGQKVLDMGCGTGELTAYTANQVGFENVFGVDPDPNREVTELKLLFKLRETSVLHNFVFHWLNTHEKEEYLNRAVKCLKPGGRLAIHSADDWPQPIAALLEMAVAVSAMKPAPYFVGRTAVDSMCKELGFKILTSETLFYEYKFASVESFLAWTCATFYIDESKFSSLVEKERLMKFSDKDGSVIGK